MEKITNVVALSKAMETLATIEGFDSEVIEKLGKMKASFEKKSSTLRKPTATQLDNENIKVEILGLYVTGTEYLTVSDIVIALGNKYSNQKISALVRALVASNELKRTEDKRKAYFSKA